MVAPHWRIRDGGCVNNRFYSGIGGLSQTYWGINWGIMWVVEHDLTSKLGVVFHGIGDRSQNSYNSISGSIALWYRGLVIDLYHEIRN